jgi:hypothetical protein
MTAVEWSCEGERANTAKPSRPYGREVPKILSAGVIMLSPATQYFEYSQLRHQHVSQDSVEGKCSETHYSQYSTGQQFVNR